MKKSPTLLRGEKAGRENDSMEWNIVFAHELEEFYILIDPPIFIILLK